MHDRRHHFKGVCTQGDIIPPKMQLFVWQDKIDDLIEDKERSMRAKDQQFEEAKEQVMCMFCICLI